MKKSLEEFMDKYVGKCEPLGVSLGVCFAEEKPCYLCLVQCIKTYDCSAFLS